MRSDLQLIQSAIGEYSSFSMNVEESYNAEFFNFYSVILPDRFKGLPSIWYFAVLPTYENIDSNAKKKIISEARTIIKEVVPNKHFPLVMISDEQGVNLSSELFYKENLVFFLDKNDLPGKNNFVARDVRETPILLAVKNKFNTKEAPIALSPYSPNSPVSDWRFFGRRKELSELVDSTGNYFIIGARRIGKTSLLQEAKNKLEKKGHTVYWIQVQNLQSIQQVIEEIGRNLSARDIYQAYQSAKQIDSNYLVLILKRLKANKKRIVLILDEIGNVLSRSKTDDWNFMGTLREISQNMDIRIFASGFQEIFLKQYNEFEGPFINFGNTLKVNVFTRLEVDELLVQPLNLWGEIGDKNIVLNLIFDNFGSHPLILQYLGNILFKRMFANRGKKVDRILRELINSDDLKLLENAVNEIFFLNKSVVERAVFLKICINITLKNKNLIKSEINQAEIKNILEEVNISSTFDQRHFLLEALAMRGLLYRNENRIDLYHIASPIVWHFLNKFSSVDELYINLIEEIKEQKLFSL